jgi:hypothetical protein
MNYPIIPPAAADPGHENGAEPIAPPLPPQPPDPVPGYAAPRRRNINDLPALQGLPRPQVMVNGKPELILPNDNQTYSECARSCFEHLGKTDRFFIQGGTVVELREKNGERVLTEVTPDSFKSGLEKHFALRSRRRIGEEFMVAQKLCSTENAKTLLETSEATDFLPQIQSVLNSPVFAEDENKNLTVLSQGYHKNNGGTYVLSDRHVNEKVSLEEAKASLLGLLDDFSFATPSDKSRCLAGFISPALRCGRLLKAAFPIDLCEADQSQTGKGFRAELILSIYDEVPAIITQSSGGVGSIKESVSEALLSGKAFAALDNLRGEINCPLLESAIKGVGNRVGVRVPHSREKQLETDHVNWMATSNRAESTIDLANRSSITRIKKQPWNYKFRDYKGKGLQEHVKSKKDYYFSCIFSVVKAWHQAGKPRNTAVDHDFREWAGALDWIMQNIFGLPPLLDGHRAQQTRVASRGLSFLNEVCKAVYDSGKRGERLGPTDLASILQAKGIVPAGCKDKVDLGDWSKNIGSKMYHLFKDEQVLYVDEFSIMRTEEEYRDENRNLKTRKFYTVDLRENPMPGSTPASSTAPAQTFEARGLLEFLERLLAKTKVAYSISTLAQHIEAQRPAYWLTTLTRTLDKLEKVLREISLVDKRVAKEGHTWCLDFEEPVAG